MRCNTRISRPWPQAVHHVVGLTVPFFFVFHDQSLFHSSVGNSLRMYAVFFTPNFLDAFIFVSLRMALLSLLEVLFLYFSGITFLCEEKFFFVHDNCGENCCSFCPYGCVFVGSGSLTEGFFCNFDNQSGKEDSCCAALLSGFDGSEQFKDFQIQITF